MKMFSLWLILLGILLAPVKGAGMGCVHSDICQCFKSIELEYQCPQDNKVILHLIPDKYLKIDCYEPIPEYDLDMFPNLEAGELDYFSLRFCPLPIHSFNTTLQKFNITKINYMHLEEVSSTNFQTITKTLFYGLTDLEKLSFNLFKIKIEEDFLEYLPNLTTLFLDNNEIEEIGVNMFKYVPKLRILHLSRNFISHLPNGLFEGIPELQQLHLWKNELTSLNKNSFMGLKHLKSLELSSNKISSLDEDTFIELVELVNISLRSNNINLVPSNIFKHNTALELVRFGDNPDLILSDYVFANLTNLLKVNIDNSNLQYLPDHLFHGSLNLSEISLKNNNISVLPELIFEKLDKLKKLFLSGNQIKTLPENLFSSLKKLEELHLERNELEEIDDGVFRKTPALKLLNLRYNKILNINLHAFIELRKLLELDLSYNKYDLFYGENVEGLNPFSYCEQLQMLNLSHNEIDSFPENILDNKVNMLWLDLDYNKINYIRMASLIKVSSFEVQVFINNNNVSILDFLEIKFYSKANTQNFDASHNTNTSTVLYLYNNPITCDCTNFDLIMYNNDKIDPVVKTLVDIRIGNLHCAAPESFKEIEIRDLKPYHVTCPVFDKGCPRNCTCNYRPYDKHAVVDCAHRNLTNPPLLNLQEFNSKVEVRLEGNHLEASPYRGLGYENVTKLYLLNNKITNISWIPPKIEILNLNGNQLKFIDSTILDSLNQSTTLKNLSLSGNPWTCGCSAVSLQNYLRSHFTKVKATDVICADNNKPLINRKELCKSHLAIALAIAVPILVILFVAATVVALYFYYQEPIKVWLYAKNLCLWWITQEELDKDKTYDVFVSYSHKDEDFVLQNLLPVLEQGPNPFKVCIHVRDWIPGQYIATQITNSVLNSRRTLVVLSEDFLESVWGKMEFRAAHTQAISDGCARVIVIKYGNVNEEKLDNELKTYLKTNTYVEWGDPWFWNKLKYALPHSRNKFYNNNQKHANIMLKIDDKFELASTPAKHAETTPPAVSLNPSFLKDHPLNGMALNSDVPLITR